MSTQYFTYIEGTDRVTLRDDAPEWVRNVIYECHGDMLPNDWVYTIAKAAFDSPIGDDPHDLSDSLVEIYTKNLAQWYVDVCLSSVFADAESDADSHGDINGRLMTIQYYAIARIVISVWEARREHEAD